MTGHQEIIRTTGKRPEWFAQTSPARREARDVVVRGMISRQIGYLPDMLLPKPRGSLSEWTFDLLRRPPDAQSNSGAREADDDTDAAVTLWALHELTYRGFEDTHELVEHNVLAVAVRASLEAQLETRLRARWAAEVAPPGDVVAALLSLIEEDSGPSLADYVHRRADREQVLELLRQRSVYQLKEADPMTWVVPRLPVRAKAALVELQFDEYGIGNPNKMHSRMFALGMGDAGLRPDYGAYVDDALPEVLELNNALSMFGLQRRLRGAAVGHLAAFEATSSLPARHMVQGLERLGVAPAMAAYYSEHVEADAVHEQVAVHDICGYLTQDEPELADDVLFGAFTCLDQEARFASAMLSVWGAAA